MSIYSFQGKNPRIDASAYIDAQATIIGDVTIGPNCYVAAGARLRGDWGFISIGAGSNVQENAVIHASEEFPAIIGKSCQVGHGAIIHGAKVGERATIGMGAILQDGAEIGDGAIVGSGAVVLEEAQVPPGKVAVGLPAKVVGEVTEAQREHFWKGTGLYQSLPARMEKGLKEV